MLKHKHGGGQPKYNKHDSEMRKLGRFSWQFVLFAFSEATFHVFCLLCLHLGSATPLGSRDLFHVTEALHFWNDWIVSNIYIPADCSISVRPASCTKGRRQPHPTEEGVAFFKLADVDRQTWIGTDYLITFNHVKSSHIFPRIWQKLAMSETVLKIWNH